MKVLHINCNYLCTTLHQLMVEKLDSLGIENTVFVPIYDGIVKAIKPNSNVIVSNCFKKWDRLIFQYKQKKILKAIKKSTDVNDYDIIHAYTLFTDGNAAYKLFKKYNISYVVAIRNTDVNNFFKKMVHLRGRGVKIMRSAEKIIFLSEAYRKTVLEKYVPKKYRNELFSKTEIIPNGIDDFWLNNSCIKQSEPGDVVKLIYAGQINKNKNITATQKAMELLREKNLKTRLTVVGKIADRSVFEEVSSSSDTVCKPPLPKEELINEYRSNDIFVMPSFAETFGLVYAEAMSQGLPVIYTRDQGFDKQFAEGEVGYSVDPYDAQSIADAIVKICDNYSWVSRDAAEKSSKFNWASIAGRYYSIYRTIRFE